MIIHVFISRELDNGKIAIISYAEDEYDSDEVEDMTSEDFDPQDVKIYDTKIKSSRYCQYR